MQPMKHVWLFICVMILTAGCNGQSSVSVMVVRPADLTATFMFVPPVGINNVTHTSSPTLTPDPASCQVYNALGAEIYLRNFPGAQHDVIATWLPNIALEVLGRTDNGWYLVRVPPGNRGWVSDEVARLSGLCDHLPLLTSANLRSPDYKLPCRVSSASGSVVSLFNLPAFDSQIVGELPQGYLMEARQRTPGGWYYLSDFLEMLPPQWNQGWVYESMVHLNGSCGGISTEEPPASAAVILANGETLVVGCTGVNAGARRVDIYVNAGMDSARLSWILPGERVRLSLRNAQGWVMAEYDAFRGWVKPDELELSGDCDSLPDLP
ncbi:MAG: SH3 domain-containing protein [Chloroflexi bacterium]|nr:SH3 domain-containing protein [Chloroflexota bacterium]MDL1883605.1 hypothetical protein [Anaerolineae bacterium CFX8]